MPKKQSRFKLSDKVRRRILKRKICFIAQMTVIVVGFAVEFLLSAEEPLFLGLLIFVWFLIEQIKESE